MTGAEAPLTASVWIDATPEDAFPFFTDPVRLTTWLGHAAEAEPTPGGRFAVDINDRLVRGSYLEVRAPHRVVFSWATRARRCSDPVPAAWRSTCSPPGAGPR